ncbi:MAG: pyruvate formate lyase family protein [Planctomycetota bacterium]
MNERLQRLKTAAHERAFAPHESPKARNYTRAFFELFGDLPLPERQARSFAHALVNEPIYIYPNERLAGQIYQGAGSGDIPLVGVPNDAQWDEFAAVRVAARLTRERIPEDAAYSKYFFGGASFGHVGWDWGRMLRIGARGIMQDARERREATDDPKAREFYLGVNICLRALIAWAARLEEALRAAAQRANPDRARELTEMADICRRVPAGGAETFREAVQSFLLQFLAVMFENPHGGNGPGRMDYILWPFLQADLDAGRITLDEARDWIIELFIKLHERLGPRDGWVEAIVVGGRNPDGSSAVTPLSHLIVEAIMELEQTHPSVYIRLHEDAPEEFWDLAARYLLEGGNRAQIYGDDNVIKALHKDGVAVEDARNWCAGGCMEVSPQACNGDLLFTFAHNVVRTMELVLNGGRLLLGGEQAIAHDKCLTDYRTFDELWDNFETELERELRILMRRLDIYLECSARYRPAYLLSSMTHDCLERGRNINDGGARYPDYGGSGVGIPNVGDSLYALKRAVFDEKRFGAGEILDALRKDFEGHERMRAYLWNLPKFGGGNSEAIEMTDRVMRAFCRIIKSHRNPLGGHARPIILGFTWVVSHGLQTGATPDGRRARRPLAQSLSPQSGAALHGLTAALSDATKLSLDEVGGGGSMMWDLDPHWATPDVVKALLRTFIQQGGHIFQGNLVSPDLLVEAQKHPDEYRSLMVRVGGYSALFHSLSAATQTEIIERYRYAR